MSSARQAGIPPEVSTLPVHRTCCRVVVRPSIRYSRQRFTLRHHAVLLCPKVKKTTTYRDLVDELIEMPRILDTLDIDSIPAPSILCKAFDRLEMAVWRVVLTVSLADLPVDGVTGIDASGFERARASTHYAKRANLTVQQLKTTLLVDTATNAVLDIHVTTRRKKHDTRIAPQVVKRNAESIAVLTGDKGYETGRSSVSPVTTVFGHPSSVSFTT